MRVSTPSRRQLPELRITTAAQQPRTSPFLRRPSLRLLSITGWTFGETANAPTVTSNARKGTVTYEYKLKGADDKTYSKDAPNAAGEYTVRATIADTVNYLGAGTTADFTIAKKSLTVTADKASKVYGTDDPALTYAEVKLVGEDKLTGKLTRAEGENVGEYAITQGTLTASNNYTITFVPGKLTITAAEFPVNASGFEGVYDGKAHGIPHRPPSRAQRYIILRLRNPALADFTKANQTASPTYTDAGTYKVWYCITAENYQPVISYQTVKITKAQIPHCRTASIPWNT